MPLLNGGGVGGVGPQKFDASLEALKQFIGIEFDNAEQTLNDIYSLVRGDIGSVEDLTSPFVSNISFSKTNGSLAQTISQSLTMPKFEYSGLNYTTVCDITGPIYLRSLTLTSGIGTNMYIDSKYSISKTYFRLRFDDKTFNFSHVNSTTTGSGSMQTSNVKVSMYTDQTSFPKFPNNEELVSASGRTIIVPGPLYLPKGMKIEVLQVRYVSDFTTLKCAVSASYQIAN